jgi:ribose transport system substrate-binding protein
MAASLAATTLLTAPAGASSSPVAAAKAAITSAETIPTKIGVTTPLKSTPPKGKTVVFLQCAEDQCSLQGKGITAAAAALGWQEKTLQFQESNPATLVSAMNEALQYNPVAVYFSGVPEAAWASEIPVYKKAGVAIVPSFVGAVPTNSTVIANLGGTSFSTQEGNELANYVIADSNDSASVLFVTVPAYTTFVPVQQAFSSKLGSCRSCTMNPLDITIPQLQGGQLVPAVVSALQKAPQTKYVVSVNGAFLAGLPAALSAAGLSGKFKIVSASASTANEQDVKSGVERATMGDGGFQYGGWLDVDVVLRHLEGMKIVPGDGGFPTPLLTKANVGTPSPDDNVPANYPQQFAKLWKVK